MYFIVCSKDFSFIKPLYVYKIELKNNMNKKKRKIVLYNLNTKIIRN